MWMNAFEGERGLLPCFLCFKIDSSSTIDTVVICCTWCFIIGFRNFGGTALRVINLDNLYRCRLLMYQCTIAAAVICIGIIQIILQRHPSSHVVILGFNGWCRHHFSIWISYHIYHLFLLYTNFLLISTFAGNVVGKIYFYKGKE